MADTKISAMTVLTGLAGGDKLAVADASDLTVAKAFTLDELKVFLSGALGGLPLARSLTSAYTNSTTTGTEVTGLSFNGLAAGTYYVKWMLLFQSAAATTSVKFGVNYSGTVTRMSMVHHYPSNGTSSSSGTWDDDSNLAGGAIWSHRITRTATTTAPNLGPGVGVVVADVDHYCDVEGIVVVSDAGDLELWAGSEVAASQITLSAGSSGLLWRLN